MKKFKINTLATIVAYVMSVIIFTSCDDVGVTTKKLNGDEQNLPAELKGLKIYSVSTGDGSYVKVGVLDGKINSTNYQEGEDIQESVVIINKKDCSLIQVSQILFENDSLIICRK